MFIKFIMRKLETLWIFIKISIRYPLTLKENWSTAKTVIYFKYDDEINKIFDEL